MGTGLLENFPAQIKTEKENLVSRAVASLKILLERSEERFRSLQKENSELIEVILDLTRYIKSQKKLDKNHQE